MFSQSNRVHDQIVELLTKAHDYQDSIDSRIQSLQQAMELLLYHTSGNERVDEFLETFLSMHADKNVAVRRFAAHFIEVLVYTRSRFACSCLEVLVTLLQDSDKQVVIFALRATRIVYKRALFWISLQQREMQYLQAARESLQTLDFLLARVVHVITSSQGIVFCEAIRCAQSVVLVQSLANMAPRNQSQLEVAGCGCIEDLRLIEVTSVACLDEAKLRAQADRLFTALCALLIKRQDQQGLSSSTNDNRENAALIHAVGIVGHARVNYTGAAISTLGQVVNGCRGGSTKAKNGLSIELKRILSSRYCIEWQPVVVGLLQTLGHSVVGKSTSTTSSVVNGKSTDSIVLEAEMDRMKEQLEVEDSVKGKRSFLRHGVLDADSDIGEKYMRISDLADGIKVPDESNAIAVFSVRAQNSSDLAKLALGLLSRLPKKFSDPAAALQRINKSAGNETGGSESHSIGFGTRVNALRSMGVSVEDFVLGEEESKNDMDIEPVEKSSGEGVRADVVSDGKGKMGNVDSRRMVSELMNMHVGDPLFEKIKTKFNS